MYKYKSVDKDGIETQVCYYKKVNKIKFKILNTKF